MQIITIRLFLGTELVFAGAAELAGEILGKVFPFHSLLLFVIDPSAEIAYVTHCIILLFSAMAEMLVVRGITASLLTIHDMPYLVHLFFLCREQGSESDLLRRAICAILTVPLRRQRKCLL